MKKFPDPRVRRCTFVLHPGVEADEAQIEKDFLPALLPHPALLPIDAAFSGAGVGVESADAGKAVEAPMVEGEVDPDDAENVKAIRRFLADFQG